MTTPRPSGFDYSIPDPESERCGVCNRDGMNRTGLEVICLVGASTVSAHGIPCRANCVNGLRVKEPT